jgi:ABC-type transport system involved in cytochrome bd biosynthesis fused ATPase/permease subunit
MQIPTVPVQSDIELLRYALTQLGVAGLLFVVWLLSFRNNNKQQKANFMQMQSQYKETLEKLQSQHEATLIHFNNQYQATLDQVQKQNKEYSQNLEAMTNRLFKALEKESDNKEILVGTLTEMKIQLKQLQK